jgi:hypothetical protein
MKREIWKWQPAPYVHSILVEDREKPGTLHILASVNNNIWSIWCWPFIAGVQLKMAGGECDSLDTCQVVASLEIQRQLKAHGIEREIRRVKR